MGRPAIIGCLLALLLDLHAAVMHSAEARLGRHGHNVLDAAAHSQAHGASPANEDEALLHQALFDMVDDMRRGRFFSTDNSNVTQCSARLALNPVLFPEPDPLAKVSMPEGARGAVIVSWSGRGGWHSDSASMAQWECQLSTVKNYCKKYGYTFYLFNDTAEKQAERERDELRPYWLKIQAMRDVLPKHAWVMHVDTDSMFPSLDVSRPVEDILAATPANSRGASLYVPDDYNWNTDTVLVRNTDWGRNYLEQVWALRIPCPMCVKGSEQCALELAMYQSAIQHQLDAGGSDIQKVATTPFNKREGGSFVSSGSSSCCFPTAFCHYPLGRTSPANIYADTRPMYCVASWLQQYFREFRAKAQDGWISSGHQHIVWKTDLRTTLGMVHPAKTNTSCECLKRTWRGQAGQEAPGTVYKNCRDW